MAPELLPAWGFVMFGTPPIGSPKEIREAFLPDPE
jgi:hypothetical protein